MHFSSIFQAALLCLTITASSASASWDEDDMDLFARAPYAHEEKLFPRESYLIAREELLSARDAFLEAREEYLLSSTIQRRQPRLYRRNDPTLDKLLKINPGMQPGHYYAFREDHPVRPTGDPKLDQASGERGSSHSALIMGSVKSDKKLGTYFKGKKLHLVGNSPETIIKTVSPWKYEASKAEGHAFIYLGEFKKTPTKELDKKGKETMLDPSPTNISGSDANHFPDHSLQNQRSCG